MYERILVSLDGSKLAECVMPYVEELVDRLASPKPEITLLQVISSTYHYVVQVGESVQVPYTEEELKPIKRSAGDYLTRIGNILKKKGATINVMVTAGDAAGEILRIAKEIDASLIAMTTHGRTGIARWVLGSVADKVIRTTNVPLLVVRCLDVPKE